MSAITNFYCLTVQTAAEEYIVLQGADGYEVVFGVHGCTYSLLISRFCLPLKFLKFCLVTTFLPDFFSSAFRTLPATAPASISAFSFLGEPWVMESIE